MADFLKEVKAESGFTRFFGEIWEVIYRKSRGDKEIEWLGTSGRARVLSGRAFQDFCFNVLSKRSPSLRFERDRYVRDGYSMKPDISVWKENSLLAILEFKVGHDFQQLRSVAMEKQLLRSDLGRDVPVLFLTRKRGEKNFTKERTRKEYDRLRGLVEPFFFPIDPPDRERLRGEIDRLVRFVESALDLR